MLFGVTSEMIDKLPKAALGIAESRSRAKEHAMLGPQDLWIALALGVFFFGAKKLPELSRSLGQAMSEFKKGVASGVPAEPETSKEVRAPDERTNVN